MRTPEEIKEAVERLKNNKTEKNQFNFFGEDNHKRIDIMIDTIQEQRSEDYVYQNYQSTFPDGSEDTIGHGNWSSAMYAIGYLRGEYKLEDLLYPQ